MTEKLGKLFLQEIIFKINLKVRLLTDEKRNSALEEEKYQKMQRIQAVQFCWNTEFKSETRKRYTEEIGQSYLV